MHRIEPVQNFDLPELAPYRTMRLQQQQRNQGIFVAESAKVVLRLLESPLEIVSLLLPPRWAETYAPLLDQRTETIVVYTAEKKLLETLTGYSMYQGVLAVARVPAPVSIDQALRLSARPHLFLAVDGLSNAENLGGLVRNCAAFGAGAIVVGETCCSPYLRRAVRSSMGAVFKQPVVESPNLLADLHQLKAAGLRLIAAHPHTDRKWVHQASFTGDSAIILGSEGQGISAAILAACDEQVAIPMHNEVDSLNVGTAGAVFLYEARRQRQEGLPGSRRTT